MSGCTPTDDVKKIIRAMAKAKVEEGFTNANDIVDEIHDAIRDHTPLWKNEIADIISGYGKKPSTLASRTELQQRLIQLRRDLKAIHHPPSPKPTPEETRNLVRQKQLQKQIDAVREQIRTGNFTKVDRVTPGYDPKTLRMQADYENAKLQAARLLSKLEYQNHSRAYKIGSTINELRRAAILSGVTVVEHLGGAVAWRLIATPFEQLMGAGLRHVPGLKQIDEKALTEGGGFGGKPMLEGLKGAVSKETLRDMRDKVLRGYSDKALMYGQKMPSNHPFLAMVGQLHDAIKTPAENFGFYKAKATIDAQMRRQLAREGKTPDEIDAFLQTPTVMARNGAMAFAEGQRAKLQAANKFTDWLQSSLRQLEHKGGGYRAASQFARYEMPIMKIPTNLFAETTSYTLGEFKAIASLIGKKRETLTSEQADYVMRNLKKGLVGKALLALGWFFASSFGGMYDSDEKKHGDLEYGDINIDGHVLSHHLAHSPFTATMQMGAMARNVFDREVKKKGVAVAGMDAALKPHMSAMNDLPFVDAPKNLFKALSGAEGMGDFLGKSAGELEPQIVKQIAAATDPEKALKRRPKGFLDQLKMGVPGLREQVPLQSTKAMSLDQRLDAYDKMTPAERESTDIVNKIGALARRHQDDLTPEQLQRLENIQP